MSSLNNILASLKGQLVVSCQAEPPSPFDNPKDVTSFARCAIMGGAAGIRSCGIEKIKAILEITDLPVIGLTKSRFPDGTIRITGTFAEVESLVNIGTPIIAVDGTFREREDALTGPQYIAALREKYPLQLFMADISTPEEALACRKSGADCVSTTLAGYTQYTVKTHGPDLDLIKALADKVDVPVIAEGRFLTPEDVDKGLAAGAHSVVIGKMITNAMFITSQFIAQSERIAK